MDITLYNNKYRSIIWMHLLASESSVTLMSELLVLSNKARVRISRGLSVSVY